MNRDQKYIYFSDILKIIIIWCGFLLFGTFVCQYVFKHYIVADVWTYGLIGLFCFFLYTFVSPAKESYETSIRLGVGFFVLLVFLQRIIVLMWFPDTFGLIGIDNKPVYPYTLNEFNFAIFMYGVFLLVFHWGIKTAKYAVWRTPKVITTFPDYIKAKGIIYILVYFSIILVTVLGILFNWKMGTKWEFGWLVRLFPNSIYATMLALLLVAFWKRLSKLDIGIIVFYFVLTTLWSLIQGSRGGIYALVITFMTIAIVVRADFKLRRKIVLVILILVALLGPILWITGNAIRNNIEVKEAILTMNVVDTVQTISRRLGESTEKYIMEVNRWGNQEVIDSMLTIVNIFKAAINASVPGDLFTAPYESTGNLWMTIFHGEKIGSRVQGTVWSGFGFLYTLFRGWSFLVVFLWAFLSTWLFKELKKRGSLFHLLLAVQVYFILFEGFFMNGNLDNILTDLISSFANLAILFVFLAIVIGAAEPKPKRELS